MLDRIYSTFNKLYNKISLFPFIFAFVLIWIYFWLNGPAHFSNWPDTYSELMLYYLGMIVIFVIFANRPTQQYLKQQTIASSMVSFVLFFILTLFMLLIVVRIGLFTQPEFNPVLFWPVIILQIFVVATAEEVMFRGVILGYFKTLAFLGIIIQALLFALWHSYAYQIQYYDLSTFNFPILLMAFIMGILLGIIAKSKYGLPACIAIHSCWNIVILGAIHL